MRLLVLCLKPLLSNISSTSCQLLPDSHDSCTRTCICSLPKLQSRVDGGTIHRYILHRGLGPRSLDTLAVELAIVDRGLLASCLKAASEQWFYYHTTYKWSFRRKTGSFPDQPAVGQTSLVLYFLEYASSILLIQLPLLHDLWDECLSSIRRRSLDRSIFGPTNGLSTSEPFRCLVFALPSPSLSFFRPFVVQTCPSSRLFLFRFCSLQAFASSGRPLHTQPSPSAVRFNPGWARELFARQTHIWSNPPATRRA